MLYIILFRYIDLTDEEKEKLKSSAKVAKKLEKLENLGQDRDGDSSDDDGDNEEYPSLESDALSPRSSEPTSLTESMQLVDSILSDCKIDRLDKIDRLEAALSAVTNNEIGEQKCCCSCHKSGNNVANNRSAYFSDAVRVVSPTNRFVSVGDDSAVVPLKENCLSASTQTLSTGDVVVTKIFFNEGGE